MAYDFAHGSGTANDPYQIWNQTDLEGIGQENSDGQPNYFGNYFKQMADLDLVDYECNSLVMVNCSYDGDNHKVTGLEDFFFYQQIGGVLKNLVFVSPTISKSDTGFDGTGIISFAQNYFDDAEIENVVVLGATISGELYVGGIIGQADYVNFSDCFVLGSKISGQQYVGGLIGFASSNCSFERCITHGEVEATDESSYAGGFAGYLAAEATKCGADVDVVGQNYVGGFVGEGNNTNIENCYALGNVVGYDYVGGFGGIL